MSYTDRLGNIRLSNGSIAIPAPRPFDGEGCIKSISPLARAIEALPMEDYVKLMVGLINKVDKAEKPC